MMRILKALLLTLPIVLGLWGGHAQAQRSDRPIDELYNDLRAAVCMNDWDAALEIMNPMIDSPDITSSYREALIAFRQQIEGWRSSQTAFLNQPQCQEINTQRQRSPVPLSREPDETRTTTATNPAPSPEPLNPQPSRPPEGADAPSSLLSQCIELGNIINWTDSQATSLFQQTDVADLRSLVGMLSGLAGLSEQAVSDLRGIRLSDGQLQNYQQDFISIYNGFSQITRGFINAANAGDYSNMERSNTEIQNLASQELALIDTVNDYCGREIIADN